MNIKLEIFGDRIGPDLLLTHWMLYFKSLGRFISKKKLKSIGLNSEVRPYVTLVGGKNITIGNNVTIRSFTQIHADSKINGSEVIIQDNVLIAPNVFITTNNHNYQNTKIPILLQGGSSKPILIKEGAWIAAGVVLLGGVTIGRNSVVAAGAIVNSDVPDFCLYGGVPAKLIKRIDE